MEMQRLLYRMYVYAEDKSGVGGMEPNRVVVDNNNLNYLLVKEYVCGWIVGSLSMHLPAPSQSQGPLGTKKTNEAHDMT